MCEHEARASKRRHCFERRAGCRRLQRSSLGKLTRPVETTAGQSRRVHKRSTALEVCEKEEHPMPEAGMHDPPGRTFRLSRDQQGGQGGRALQWRLPVRGRRGAESMTSCWALAAHSRRAVGHYENSAGRGHRRVGHHMHGDRWAASGLALAAVHLWRGRFIRRRAAGIPVKHAVLFNDFPAHLAVCGDWSRPHGSESESACEVGERER
eukprot:350866-Chlamydomonas_euryale.AAC.8